MAIAPYSCIKFMYIHNRQTYMFNVYTCTHVCICISICLSIHLFLYMKSMNVRKWQSSYKNSSLGNTYSLGLVPQEKIFREQNKFRKDSCLPLYFYIFLYISIFFSSELYNVLTWNCYFLK